MFTDMVGYSALAQADESSALAILERHNQLLRPVFARFSGREVKTIGDAFLVEFDSAVDSTRCALEIQRVLRDHNAASNGEPKIRVRIGLHVGDVIHAAGDVLGDVVNIASRIQAVADPESVCVTQQVYDQVHNKIQTSFTKLPPMTLKNIQGPINVYKAVPAWNGQRSGKTVPEHGGPRSIAVLPLVNISPDPHDEYFAEGLTEELISVLSQVRDLSVIARSSVLPYKSAPKPIAQIGLELGVDAVLEGSVRKAGQRIRITLQLIDAATQRHLWSSSYNREVDDVFAVQTDIAERTAEALRLEFTRAGRKGGRGRPTSNPAAYDLFLRGLVASDEHTNAGAEEAIRSFEEATVLDPQFAEAFAAWANLYVMAAGDFLPMQEVMPQARRLAARALQIDPESSDAYAALANISFQFDHAWQLAEEQFRKAIALNPSNVVAHRFLGLMLTALGRFEDAREVVRDAIRLDPGGGGEHTMALIDISSGRYDDALQILEKPDHHHRHHAEAIHRAFLGFTYLAAGRRADALKVADIPASESDEDGRFDLAILNALLGRPEAARAVAAEVERGEAKSYTSATHLSMLYAALGEKNRALELLEKEAREGDRVLWLWYRGVWYDSIRDDPRFIALLRLYDLPIHSVREPSLGAQ
jgi:adenylate cyclase